MPQVLFAATLLGALLGFGVMFDRLADALDAHPAEMDMWLFPASETATQHRGGRPR